MLGGKPRAGLGQSEFVAEEIHQVRGILAVMDRKGAVESDLVGVLAQEPGADRVECS